MRKFFMATVLSFCLPLLSWGVDFQPLEVPQGRNCLTAIRLASLKGLPDFSVSSSAAINPDWRGSFAIVFNAPGPELRLPLDPWASGRHELKIGYVTGGSYSGFTAKVNGHDIGKASSSSGKAAPALAIFKTEPLWACGNTLDLVPDGPGAVALVFIAFDPIEFEAVPDSSFMKLSELERTTFLLNVVPYSSPYLRLSSGTPCLLKVNGKEFIRCEANGSVLKQLENPGSAPVKIELKFDAQPSGFKLESSSLGGGKTVSVLPSFMNSEFSVDAMPKAKISNGLVEAVVALPDPEHGFYRGIRFEQAGVIVSLKADGHEFIGGAELSSHDPFRDVCGPVEEFSDAVGFHEPGLDCFLKIGVGVFERPLTKDYAFGWLFLPKELFKWDCEVKESSVEFRQKVSTKEGWAYEYVKRLSLLPDSKTLLVEHSLKNTGSRRLVSSHYCHNYFLVDRLPPGPDYSLDFSFRPFLLNSEAAGGFTQNGAKISFKGPAILFSPVVGCLDPKGSIFVLAHKPTGASVAISESSAPFRQALYVSKDGICPESFARIDLGLGESVSWSRGYSFDSK